MAFPQPTIPFVINPFTIGNMVHRNVWNHTAQVLREINRISNQIQENLILSNGNCDSADSNCASSASACASKSSACASASSAPATTSINGDTFEVQITVEHFKPEEISVKLIDCNNLIIEGKHEERSDNHGFISRSFSRRYIIPDIYDLEKLESQLSLNGLLTIKAPRKPIKGENGEIIIPITLTSNISLSLDETINKSTSETIPIIQTSETIPIIQTSEDNQTTTTIDGSDQKKPEATIKND